jgi:hypothetical protein
VSGIRREIHRLVDQHVHARGGVSNRVAGRRVAGEKHPLAAPFDQKAKRQRNRPVSYFHGANPPALAFNAVAVAHLGHVDVDIRLGV